MQPGPHLKTFKASHNTFPSAFRLNRDPLTRTRVRLRGLCLKKEPRGGPPFSPHIRHPPINRTTSPGWSPNKAGNKGN
ncbi:hypothetical protein NPIL_684691 [Nephila pilipes]|uniref:Uncharacterized protein n=1 Tax=Nephila pilipes TaxID=299642 RepID=A0A8X6UHN1_NEPPI|nr:hypothetical protein NPIL_457761 [Nephila pilipes]GFU33849.1 hypothetical protein NPIL_684691 [Nephila pilipes]